MSESRNIVRKFPILHEARTLISAGLFDRVFLHHRLRREELLADNEDLGKVEFSRSQLLGRSAKVNCFARSLLHRIFRRQITQFKCFDPRTSAGFHSFISRTMNVLMTW